MCVCEDFRIQARQKEEIMRVMHIITLELTMQFSGTPKESEKERKNVANNQELNNNEEGWRKKIERIESENNKFN